jgi:putative hydrolases of HD superfamily
MKSAVLDVWWNDVSLKKVSLSSKINVPRCTKMALIHNMAESLVGGFTSVDGVPKVEKNRREAATMDYICDDLLRKVHGGLAGKDIREV